MGKINSKHIWIEIGYSQFAEEGLEGLQVERLSRIIGLNKSGFYHYFGDKDLYIQEVLSYHFHEAEKMVPDFNQIKEFDPQFMEVLMKHTPKLMFHNQLVRNRQEKELELCYERVNNMIDPTVSRLVGDFVGLTGETGLAEKYYKQVRDTFYSQITLKKMNYAFLRSFLYEAKDMIQLAIELGSEKKKV